MNIYPIFSGTDLSGLLTGTLRICSDTFHPIPFQHTSGAVSLTDMTLRRFIGESDIPDGNIDTTWQILDFLFLLLAAGLLMCVVVFILAAIKRRKRERLQSPRKDYYHKHAQSDTRHRRSSSK